MEINKRESTYIKGMAILMIVISHIFVAFGLGVLRPLGPVGVFLFLFMSGYGVSFSFEKSYSLDVLYFKNKIQKVYLPYLCAIFLFCIWQHIIGIDYNVKEILSFAFLTKLAQGSYWYLILQFYWYLMFFVINKLYSRKYYLLVLFLAIIPILIIEKFNIGIVWQFASFQLGVFLKRNSRLLSEIKYNTKLINSLLLIIVLGSAIAKKLPYVEQQTFGFVDTALQIALTYSIGIFVILNRKVISNIMRNILLVEKIGIISYPIFLAQAIPLDYLNSNASSKTFAVYISVFSISTVLLILIDSKFIQCKGR